MYGTDKTNPIEYSDGYKLDAMNTKFCSVSDSSGFGLKSAVVAETVETGPVILPLDATTDLNAMLAADDAVISTEDVVAAATAEAEAEPAQVKPDINLPEFDKMHLIQLQGLANSVINGDFDIAVENGYGS